jgi:hypothetical protein
MSVADSPTSIGTFRCILGITIGSIGVAFAILVCYRVATFPFLAAENLVLVRDRYWPGTIPTLPRGAIPGHLGLLYLEVGLFPVFGITVCVALAAICIYVLRGRLAGWILGISGVAIAVASWPLGHWALRIVMAKYHLVDVG